MKLRILLSCCLVVLLSLGLASCNSDSSDSDMVTIPAGEFTMGTNDGTNGEGPAHEVYLDAYSIDKYEVTNGKYEACVSAGGCTVPDDLTSNKRTDYYGNPDYADYPVTHVDWGQAAAYCEWAGGRLPTEAEWEKAARGSSDARIFPWGDASPTCELANFYGNCDVDRDTTAVGSYPSGASPYGVQDMAGNVNEWVNDWFDEEYYNDPSALDNPQGPASGTVRGLRGGAWGNLEYDLRAVNRISTHPAYTDNYYGFRCAYSP